MRRPKRPACVPAPPDTDATVLASDPMAEGAPSPPATDPNPAVHILGGAPAPPARVGADVVHVYALLGSTGRYHYVGITRQTLDARLRQHLAEARRGAGGPRGDWLR